MIQHRSSEPQRRSTDYPHDLAWWAKIIGIGVGLTTLVTMALAVGSHEIGTPIMAKLDSVAVRDSVRLEAERDARIAGDNNTDGKLNTIIMLLKENRRGR